MEGLNQQWLRAGQSFDLLTEWDKAVVVILPSQSARKSKRPQPRRKPSRHSRSTAARAAIPIAVTLRQQFFFAQEFPHLAAVHGHLVAEGMTALGASKLVAMLRKASAWYYWGVCYECGALAGPVGEGRAGVARERS